MTEETQALVRQLWEWVDGQSVTYASVLMQDAAAALTALARDLETARQERDALHAQATALGHVPYLDRMQELAAARDEARKLAENYVQMLANERAANLAAVRAARAETETAVKERDEARALHQELMFQVGSKWPGETRHETAKRYIREREDLGRLPPFGGASAAREGQ
jgi:hypothetical protein